MKQNNTNSKKHIFPYTITVGKEVLDGNKHVNNVAYVQWMQDAAVSHSRSSGCTQATKEIGAIWVARSHWIKYRRPAFEGDVLTVYTWVSTIQKVTSKRKYKFIRMKDKALIAEGETDWAFVDAQSGKPRAIPQEISDAFTVLPENHEPVDLFKL